MPTLVNHSGDEGFCHGGSFLYANPLDSSLFLSLGYPHVDVYCPPRKRSRITAPFVFRDYKSEEQQKQQQQQPSIDVLPDECLFEIFRRVPAGQEKSACACVSKRWLTLLSSLRKEEALPVSGCEDQEVEGSDGLLTRCLEGKKATDIRLAAIAVGTCSRGGLGKLLIRGSNSTRGVTNVGLSSIARGCPSLKVLSLWNSSSVGDEGLSEIANGCHKLEKLDLCHCPSISDTGLVAIAENCPNLTDIVIESCSNIGNTSLQAIGKFCRNLKSISIRDCPLIGDQGVVSLLTSGSNALTKVKFQALNISDVSLAVIGHYGLAVTDLVLNGLHNVSERGFWVMGNTHGLQKLKSFTITSCKGVTDLGLEALGKSCPNLKQFCLHRCPLLSDKGLVAFARAASSLESLELEECNGITQSGVLGTLINCGANLKALALIKCIGIMEDKVLDFPLTSLCKSLQSLSIRNCPGFGNDGLALMGKLCPLLQHVDLVGLCGISDAGFLSLLESCEAGLVKVNLSGCMNLTDAIVLAMVTLHGGSLQLLNLDGCRKITDASLAAVADSCSLLQDLDVSKCAVTDIGIATLSRAKQLDLQVLSFSGCSQVSEKCMPFLANLGKALMGLNLQRCNSISSSTVDMLVEHLWRCDILF